MTDTQAFLCALLGPICIVLLVLLVVAAVGVMW